MKASRACPHDGMGPFVLVKHADGDRNSVGALGAWPLLPSAGVATRSTQRATWGYRITVLRLLCKQFIGVRFTVSPLLTAGMENPELQLPGDWMPGRRNPRELVQFG